MLHRASLETIGSLRCFIMYSCKSCTFLVFCAILFSSIHPRSGAKMRVFLSADMSEAISLFSGVFTSTPLSPAEAGQRVLQGVVESPTFRNPRDKTPHEWILQEIGRLFGTVGASMVSERSEETPTVEDAFLWVHLVPAPECGSFANHLGFCLLVREI